MTLRRTLAALAAVSLAAGGLLMTATAANAAPGDSVVLASQIKTPNAAEENDQYNDWHYDPSSPGRAVQHASGLLITPGSQTLIVKGNGNNKTTSGTPAVPTLAQTIESLDIDVAIDASPVFYQVPVFYGADVAGKWQFTTLRKNVTDGSNEWISSQPVGSIAANTSTPLGSFVTEMGPDARAIATGFIVDKATDSVIVRSFTSDGATTKFASALTPCVAPAASSNFVDAADIRANEETYPGWHNGMTKTETVKNFASIPAGLEVTGNAQILNGLADPAEFQANCLSAAASMTVDVVESTGPVATQVPVFYYPNGARSTEDRLFTTIRLADSAELGDAEALWTTSSAIYADAAKTTQLFAGGATAPLAEFVAAIGVHDVIGYGFYVNVDQSATVSSVTFNNQTTNFAEPVSVAPMQPVKPVAVETGVKGA